MYVCTSEKAVKVQLIRGRGNSNKSFSSLAMLLLRMGFQHHTSCSLIVRLPTNSVFLHSYPRTPLSAFLLASHLPKSPLPLLLCRPSQYIVLDPSLRSPARNCPPKIQPPILPSHERLYEKISGYRCPHSSYGPAKWRGMFWI